MADTKGVEIEIKFDDAAVIKRLKERTEITQSKLDAQILKDSNYYCPLDTSNLQKSAVISSVIGSGLLTWRTPYARAQYYGLPNKNTTRNPNASVKWFEAAKSKNLKTWVKIANDEFN